MKEKRDAPLADAPRGILMNVSRRLELVGLVSGTTIAADQVVHDLGDGPDVGQQCGGLADLQLTLLEVTLEDALLGAPLAEQSAHRFGVGTGGVLEPLQASPTIIEDNCFIGARSEIVEGVIVEEGSVISMGVFIGQSTKIFDRTTGEIYQGRVPAGSVVVSGSMPSKDGSHSLYCAVIVKRVDAQTRAKTSVNELLRGI